VVSTLAFLSGFFFTLGVGWLIAAKREQKVEWITQDQAKSEKPHPLDALTSVMRRFFGFLFPKEWYPLRKRLLLAGADITPEQYVAVRVAGMVVAAALTLLLSLIMGALGFVLGVLVFILAFLAPERWLEKKIEERTKAIQREILPFVELLAISATGGYSTPVRALEHVLTRTRGVLADIFERLLLQSQVERKSIADALLEVRNYTTVSEVHMFCHAVVQSIRHGTPFRPVVENQVHQLRESLHNRTIHLAAKMETKMVLPVMMGMLIPLFIVTLGIPIYGVFIQN